MRSDAKASTAGSNQRRAIKRKPSLLLLCLAACVAALAVVVGSASAAKTHIFKEVFGSAAQPTFTTPRGMAIDQGTGEVYVIDAGSPPSVKRYNANGTASNFSALSSNVIDGAGGADTTPQGSLAFGTANRVQIAIDESGTATDGDIYVAQQAAKLVDVFASSGEYKGQLTESSEGLLGEICGVAVDSAGKLYLGDIAGKIHVYTPAANPPVNGDSSANFATVTAPCQIAAGTGATAGFIFVNRSNGELKKVDSASGEVKYAIGSVTHRTVYVNPASGHLYAPRQTGSNSEVVEYDASGAGSATTVSSVKPGSTIEGIAVRESTGDVYLTRSGQASAQVYGPTVTQPDVTSTAVSNNTGTRATLNGTVNPDGVELDECFFEWSLNSGSFENTAPCAESNATIGSGASPVAVHADLSGLTPQGTNYKYRLVAKNPETPAVTGSQQSFKTPNTVITIAASGITPTTATLNGTVNPDTATISACVFEWGPPKETGESIQQYPNTAPCVPGPGSITGTSPVAVHADLSGLHVGTEYVYRLKATYPTGPAIGSQAIAQTAGPRILASWAESVVRTEATLKAEIDPEGQATTYHFDYGTSEAYGAQTPEISVGSDSSVHEVTRFLEGLTAGTTYHYRVVATSGAGSNEGPDRTFTTYESVSLDTACPNQTVRYGPSAKLPDCRAYEMVSPVDKDGGEILGSVSSLSYELLQQRSSLSGGKFTYTSFKSFGDEPSALYSNQYIASRSADGWSTHGINPPQMLTVYDPFFSLAEIDHDFQAFSPDLSSAWVMNFNKSPLTPDGLAGYINLYRRDNTTGGFEALTNAGPFAPTSESLGGNGNLYLRVKGYSADLRHQVFMSEAALTPDAATNGRVQTYDLVDGQLRLVNVLPNGETATLDSYPGYTFSGSRDGSVHNAVSEDGSRIFWSTDSRLYVRVDGTTTIPVSNSVAGGSAIFWGASADGSKVLFTTGTTFNAEGSAETVLYEFDVDTETPTLIAEGVQGVAGASEDASRVYFVSTDALAAGATAGEYNLYLYEEGAYSLVATVAPRDVGNGSSDPTGLADIRPVMRMSRVTPDGGSIAFKSARSLTGYDNTDAASGEADIEVFIYDADAGRLRCASCNPSGARPHGARLYPPYAFKASHNTLADTWAAAWLPTWEWEDYGSRALSEDGSRLFFNSNDALLPQDVNGVQDVYQWEAQGTGDCDAADWNFSEANGGCVSLVSTGTSPVWSEFADATPDGDSVFFRTASSIVPEDPGLIDLYVARVGGGYPRVASPTPCVGDACQSAPTPPDDPTPASAHLRGAGNPVSRRSCGAKARGALKLSRRAKRLRRAARRSQAPRRAKALRRRSARLAKRAGRLSKTAKRCRRANRRAAR